MNGYFDLAGPTLDATKPTMGTLTPPGRRSVQFARSVTEQMPTEQPRSRPPSNHGGEDADILGKNQRASLFSKLKAFAGSPSFPTHSRSASGATIAGTLEERNGEEVRSPASERDHYGFPSTLIEGGSDADADAEESATEDRRTAKTFKQKQKRKSRRRAENEAQTAPSTPKTPSRPGFTSSLSMAPLENFRPNFLPSLPRRSTTNSMNREGVSEDEGRDRMNRDSRWKRSAWMRGLTYAGAPVDGHESPESSRRPSNLRRLTAFGHEDGTSSPRRRKATRASTMGVQKWHKIKASLKLIGQKKKMVDNTVDHTKSTMLLAELAAGAPAALMLASMFQRDEHGSRRIPVLLEQLKVQLVDSKETHDPTNDKERHLDFRIELEYGNGLTRMKWIINRSLKDFLNLHAKYKIHYGSQKYIQLKGNDSKNDKFPRFPRSAFPYLRGFRGLEDEDEDNEDETAGGYETGNEGLASGTDRGGKKKKGKQNQGFMRRLSSTVGDAAAAGSALANIGRGDTTQTIAHVKKEPKYATRQRQKLEEYLVGMINFMKFRADGNRLCKFLEISALGVRLAAEGTYHGKEGYLVIQSSKGLDFRKALRPSLVKKRHTPKWFLVRHSYVVCVDSPEEMHIYDVFLVDSAFTIQTQKPRLRQQNAKETAKSAKERAAHPQHHTLKIQNSERTMRLLARNERQLHQFEESISSMLSTTPWAKPNRFDSFAPVRQNCFAQWLVDGRDYMWVVSRAINQAKDVIYIHDWWLSPELYMRRPAAISQNWRLDRLLQRKARQGVKVFVIMYRNINSAIPIDSEYSKFSLLDLHPNIFVQRSPNQFRQNTFFWAHHEKICIVDHTLAFVGGIDLCFGRWDTPQHTVIDDKLTGFEETNMPKDADHCQLWPGKDYSNPRVQDFYALDKPYEEMYNRDVVPRMPWHDISMQVVGQPARDLTRHFVQRWNYILRQRKPTRPTPFLLPPPDFVPADLEALGLDGTCEVQILRSASMWSLGTPDRTEHSIMNAYVKMIEQSEHFVYIENQFFISTSEVEGKKIENLIGDALVERISRAARNDEPWRANIVIPLMPGFQNAVDSEGGTSVRLIMQCQYRSICRGEASIFGRLRAQGIEPDDYISFFSLRSWGKIGPTKSLVTEQLYIHAKCMIVDDRVAIIGSANINERSMLGSRDSECAAIVRDTDMIESTMAGEPYLVGRFPHTLRMRLMREHLGLDVDKIAEDERIAEAKRKKAHNMANGEAEDEDDVSESGFSNHSVDDEPDDREAAINTVKQEFLARSEQLTSFNGDVDWEQADNPNLISNRKLTADHRVTKNDDHRKDIDGEGPDHMVMLDQAGKTHGRDTTILLSSEKEVLISDLAPEDRGTVSKPAPPQISDSSSSSSDLIRGNVGLPPQPPMIRQHTSELGLPTISTLPPLPATDDADIGGPSRIKQGDDPAHPVFWDMRHPSVDKDCMRDPVNDTFFVDTWMQIAENNTKLFRSVFRCMPDNEVKTWKEYKEYEFYAERFAAMQNGNKPNRPQSRESTPKSGPPGAGSAPGANFTVFAEKAKESLASPDEKKSATNGGTADDLKEKIMGVVNGAKNPDIPASESLRQRAVEANRAQLERQQRAASVLTNASANGSTSGTSGLSKLDTTPSALGNNSSDPEKAALKGGMDSVPEGVYISPISPSFADREKAQAQFVGYSEALNMNVQPGVQNRRRRRATTRSSRREFQAADDVMSREEAVHILEHVQGHLVVFPYDWYVVFCYLILSWCGDKILICLLAHRLMKEEQGGNWLYTLDQISPLEI